ncbi:GAF domain-containing protein [Kineosphaera limosa]|nr:GAF and ANTAR domain-containing protein [Kineosphaera limosa]NYD99627.1 GAF domain-containing protein [Kineosphaera limosa]
MMAPFDVVELMDEVVRGALDLMPADSAGILLNDMRGGLRVLASSTDDMHRLELLELQHEQGPCYEAFRTGEPAGSTDLPSRLDEWTAFAPAAIEQGVTAVYAVPMSLGGNRLGALNLFCTGGRVLSQVDLQTAQVLSSMATIAVLNQQSYREQEVLAQQLQAALTSRVLIEQAKGVVAERAGVDVEQAFHALRQIARGERRLLSDVARDVVAGQILVAIDPQAPRADRGSEGTANLLSPPSSRRRKRP